MIKPVSLKKLIWIDGIAALSSGIIVSILKATLTPIFNFPENLLTTLAIVSLGYASFSIYLAQQKSISKRLLTVLVIGNSLYAIACVILMLSLYKTATLFGTVYLILESLVVALFAFLEWRQIKLYDRK